MPVVLRRDDWTEWLEPATPRGRLPGLLKPFPAGVFAWTEADRAVGEVRNNYPGLMGAGSALLHRMDGDKCLYSISPGLKLKLCPHLARIWSFGVINMDLFRTNSKKLFK